MNELNLRLIFVSASVLAFLPIPLFSDEGTTSTPITLPDSQLPLDLNDIGYGGTWERFCDPDEIQEDFPAYPDHDLRRIRILICKLRKDGKVDRQSVPVFAAYKLCNMIRSTTDYFFEELSEKFSDYDDEKKGELLASDRDVDMACYNETMKTFTEKCMGPQHVCSRMFKDLLDHACAMPWLTTEIIKSHINDVCDGKFLTDKIDWGLIFLGIRYIE